MDEVRTQFLDVGAGGQARRIAVLARPGTESGAGPGTVWLGGFRSEMTATKASALDAWGAAEGRAVTRFDYSGHGASEGDFSLGTIGRWLEEAEAVLERFAPGPQILVGSSMGGWIALLLARALIARGEGERVHALVLIAPAPDMTERLILAEMSEEEREALESEGIVHQPSAYGDPYPITRLLIEEGRRHLLLGGPIAAPFPVRILHGLDDPDVPWRLSVELVEELDGPDATLALVKHGDHRLSTPDNLTLLTRTLADL